MMWPVFFAAGPGCRDETISKNRVTDSTNSHCLPFLLTAFYIEY